MKKGLLTLLALALLGLHTLVGMDLAKQIKENSLEPSGNSEN